MNINTIRFNAVQGIALAAGAGVLAWAGIVGAIFGLVG